MRTGVTFSLDRFSAVTSSAGENVPTLLTSIEVSRLFPAHVAEHTVAFDPSAGRALESKLSGMELPTSMALAVPKRQAEFLAGRYCVREALRSCAPELAERPIEIGPHREPLWPRGVVGSIAHAGEIASAVVARSGLVRGLGLDIEPWMEESHATEVREAIAIAGEVETLAKQTGLGVTDVLTVVFSAKESIFKCLYPEVLEYFDFMDVRIVRIDLKAERFEARLLRSLAEELDRGVLLNGRVRVSPERVTTGLCLTREKLLPSLPP